MDDLEERWYLCDLFDSSTVDEPDWSKVPEDRRDRVRAAWLAKQTPIAERANLWGPQVPFFRSLPYYRVEVLHAT